MKSTINRQFCLASRPIGQIEESNFEYREQPIPQPKEGQILVRIIYLSLDPTNRIWMSDMPQYMPPVEIGAVMRGVALGQVEVSKSSQWQPGDLVSGLLGWQDYAVVDGSAVSPVPQIDGVPLSVFLGPLGMTGLTAYFGLLKIGEPKPGETVVVSAASGAVGSMVGQIARIKGCRAIGITSTAEKCRWLTEELGFDAAINYKTTELSQALAEACPQGIDVYFENVGGTILDTILTQMNLFGRIPLCGLISTYNATQGVSGPDNFAQILMKRLSVQGFIILDYASSFPEAIVEMGQWFQAGQIKYNEEIISGLENAPQAIHKLFNGDKIGKLLIKVSPEAKSST